MRIGDIEYPSLEGVVSEPEWLTRVELAALYRLAVQMDWDDLSITHISARVPGEPHYLMNPSGLLFEEVTASSLVKVDLDGRIVGDSPFEIVGGGWFPMKAVHEVREDANFVVHTHDIYGIALSLREEGLLPLTQTVGFILGDGIAYHDYDGVETYADRVAGLQQSLGAANYMILRNHGLLTLGLNARQAFRRMSSLVRSCRIQLLAGRDKLVPIDEVILATFQEELRRAQGNDPWPGLLRRLDRLEPSYRS
jgi:ribulose-5-phosphate 4-epimerase/fuculose-1-phosphate aldolase